jgi:hypothetical protein
MKEGNSALLASTYLFKERDLNEKLLDEVKRPIVWIK